jgi:hypothetical protein
LYSSLRVNEHLLPATSKDKLCAPTRQALGGGVAHPGTSTDYKRDLPITFTLHDLLRSTQLLQSDSVTPPGFGGLLADPKYWETE